jgi:hypothetical protein
VEWAKNDCTKNTLAYCIKAYFVIKCDGLRLNYVKQKDDKTVTNSKKNWGEEKIKLIWDKI